MQTRISPEFLNSPDGKIADHILRSCVHCGFCNATCPTYQLLGDELDGPRGRIYQIKQVMEGEPVTPQITAHLDRCLTCRNCETTCPSGVQYARLLDIGRKEIERANLRPWNQRLMRGVLRRILPWRRRFGFLLRIGRLVCPLLPSSLRVRIPKKKHPGITRSPETTQRTMILLDGCVQPELAPEIDAAAIRVLGRLGIELKPVGGSSCCGAVSLHLGDEAEAKRFARRNIDHWWLEIENGAEAIIGTASGCGVQIKDYAELLTNDTEYREKAARVSQLARDLGEVIRECDLSVIGKTTASRIAFQSPCTLQHGQKLGGVVESILRDLGFELTPVPDGHLCCGSAGTYSILQKSISTRLRDNKITALSSGQPDQIATANIGCLTHLDPASPVPVRHWINLVDEIGC